MIIIIKVRGEGAQTMVVAVEVGENGEIPEIDWRLNQRDFLKIEYEMWQKEELTGDSKDFTLSTCHEKP